MEWTFERRPQRAVTENHVIGRTDDQGIHTHAPISAVKDAQLMLRMPNG